MTKTILITGTSSGLGRATAKLFQTQGWNVVATMRAPEDESELTRLDHTLVTRLDVQDTASIDSAVASCLVAVGTALEGGPPHRSQRAGLPHWAPASGSGGEAHLREGMHHAWSW